MGGYVSKAINKLMLNFDWRFQHGQTTIGQITILWQPSSKGGKDPMWSSEVSFGVEDFFSSNGSLRFS